MKRITLLILAMFMSLTGFSQALEEGFEGTTTPDLANDTWLLGSGTWGVFDNGVGTLQSWTFNNGTGTPPLVYEGTRAAYMNRENIGVANTSQDYLATPLVTVPANGQLKFFTRTTLTTNNGTIYKIMVAPSSATQNDPGAYALIQLWNEDDLMEGNPYNEYIEKTVDLTAYAGTQIYIAFVMEFTQPTASIGGDRWLVDWVRVVEKCFDPENLGAGGVSQTSANLTWTNPGGANNSEIYIVPVTDTTEPVTGTVVPGNTYTATATQPGGVAFTPSTAYHYWVRALCGDGPDYTASEWVGPFVFTTQSPGLTCTSAIPITSLPYSTTDNTSNYGDTTDTNQGTSCGATGNYMTGNDVFYSFIPTTTGAINIQMTPTATWSGIFVYQGCANVGVSCIAGIGNSNSNIRVIESLNVTAGQEYIIVISTNASPQTTGYTLIIQQLNCAAPTNLSAIGNGPDNANLSWDEEGTATSWEVFVQTAGSPIPSGPGQTAGTNIDFNVTTLTGTATPLVLGTQYQYWVRSDCGDGTFSTWSGPYPFVTTSCTDPCLMSFIMVDSFGDSWNGNTMNVIQNGVPVAVLTGPANEDDTNPVTQTVSMCPGPFELFWNAGGSWAGEVGITVENSFGQVIYVKPPGTGTQNSLLFSGEVDCENPLCLPPSNLTSSNVTTFGATLNWVPNGPAPVSWDIYAVPVGQPAPDAGTIPTVNVASGSAPPYTISGLNPDTQYVYYVRAVCATPGANPWSAASPPFTTLPTCPKPTNIVATAPTMNTVDVTWTPGGTETSWMVIAVPQGSPVPTSTTPGWVTVNGSPSTTLTGLTAASSYSIYVIAVCSDTDMSTVAGPTNFNTTICMPASQCLYVFTMWDSFGDSWNGNTMAVQQNGITVATLTGPTNANGTTPITQSVALCHGVPFSLVWNTGGSWATEVGVSITSFLDENLFTHNPGTNLQGTTLYSGIAECTPPTCPKPTQLFAQNITTTSAELHWTENGSATNWEIIVLPAGSPAPGAGDSGVPASTNPFLYTGLQPGTQYTFWVRAICDENDVSIWSNPGTFSTLPGNDECIGAVFVPVNSNSSCNQVVQGTVAGATGSTVPIGTCTGTADDDVWYQFIATNSYLNIALSNITGTGANLNHAIYSGDCAGGLTLLYCSDPNTSTANNLVVGNTYFIRVWSAQSTPQTNTFTLCVSTPSTCENSPTVCNTTYTNTTGVTSLGQIGCLFTSPNPAYFTIQVLTSGPINYTLTQSSPGSPTPNLDVDYAAWGPFPNQAAVCAAIAGGQAPLTGLTTGCSYSAAPVEQFNIANAQAGQFYVILITNFSNQPGVISLTQNNAGQPGAGTTFCCSDANFSYVPTVYCKQAGTPNPTPILGSNSVAGVFSASPNTLVFVDTATGEVDLANTPAGIYVITNTLAPTENCEERHFDYTITITDPADATIAYPDTQVYCTSDGPQAVTITGTQTGTFSSTPLGGLTINPNTGEITPSTSQAGVYTVNYTVSPTGGCPMFQISTQVEIILTPSIDPISDVVNCGPYTLPALSVGNYYTAAGGTGTMLNAGDQIATSQTVYVFAGTGSCTDEESFDVTINTTPQLDPVSDVTTCSGYTLPTLTVGSYYTATGGTGTMLNAGDVISTNQTIYVYAADGICPAELSFTVSVGSVVADVLPDVTVCDGYELPTLSFNNNYYTGPGATGTMYNAGDIITASQTIYISIIDGACTDESSFVVTVDVTPVLDPVQDVTVCNSYTLPTISAGSYYTAAGGTGTMLNAGDVITTTQTIYVYAANGTCVSEASFEVTIGTFSADTLADVTACDSYTLPALSANNNFFDGPSGTGNAYVAGDQVTASTTMYIWAVDGVCTAESSFDITINQTPDVGDIQDVQACSSYTLPALLVGSYYTGPGGTGSMLNAGDVISSNQTIYVYAQTGTTPDCTDEDSFTVSIGSIVADQLADVTVCDSYVLPALSANNAYWSGVGGTGTQYNAGDVINGTITLYVYATVPGCSDESDVVITVNATPTLTPVADVTACDSYTLPALSVGNYFSGAGGTGTMLDGQTLTGSQTVYVYAQTGTTPNCSAEDSFEVTINASPTVDAVADVSACGSYTLPALASGDYFTGADGTGTMLTAGDVITASQTLYVYAQSGTTPNCTAQESFEVTISNVPAYSVVGGCEGANYVLSVVFADPDVDPSLYGYDWSAGSGGAIGTPSTGQSVTVTGAATYSVTVTQGGCSGDPADFVASSTSCKIQKGISANNDGENDYFDLEGQDVANLQIFNRYGVKVYSRRDYTNQWYGQSSDGEELPDGTYYYMIDYNAGESKTGWIYINRKN